MESSNTVGAANTKKRLESQLKTRKLHRIMIKIHEFICFTHTKISLPIIFLTRAKALWTHATHTTSAKV